MKNKDICYLIEYCNMLFEWDNSELDVDNAPESKVLALQKLQARATKQSGLSSTELTLIYICRKYRILKQVNVYANKIKNI